MRSVNVAELKNSLSRYLRLVRDGEEIVVRDRNTAVARLVPIVADAADDAGEAQLIATGQLTAGGGPIGADFWGLPAPGVSDDATRRALDSERDGW